MNHRTNTFRYGWRCAKIDRLYWHWSRRACRSVLIYSTKSWQYKFGYWLGCYLH